MNEINEFWSWFSKSLDRAIGLAEIGLVINEIGDKLLELNVDSSLWELHSNSKRDAVTQINILSFTIDSENSDYLRLASELYSKAPILQFWEVHFGVPPKLNWNGSLFFVERMESISIIDIEFEYRLIEDQTQNNLSIYLKCPTALNSGEGHGEVLRVVEQSLITILGERVYFNKAAPKMHLDSSDVTGQKIGIEGLADIYAKNIR